MTPVACPMCNQEATAAQWRGILINRRASAAAALLVAEKQLVQLDVRKQPAEFAAAQRRLDRAKGQNAEACAAYDVVMRLVADRVVDVEPNPIDCWGGAADAERGWSIRVSAREEGSTYRICCLHRDCKTHFTWRSSSTTIDTGALLQEAIGAFRERVDVEIARVRDAILQLMPAKFAEASRDLERLTELAAWLRTGKIDP
ncbi:MAG: hypothetical protein ACHREM_00235 [Polyangiales bacterium]